MTKHALLKNVNLVKLREYLNESGGDGWSIWEPAKFTKMGFKLKDLPVYKHKSDKRDIKSTIFRSDGTVGDLTGVYNLRMLSLLAGAFNVEYMSANGRGTEARRITEAVLPKLEELISQEAS